MPVTLLELVWAVARARVGDSILANLLPLPGLNVIEEMNPSRLLANCACLRNVYQRSLHFQALTERSIN